MQKSERPSPTTIDRARAASRARWPHLQLPSVAAQPLRANGKVEPPAIAAQPLQAVGKERQVQTGGAQNLAHHAVEAIGQGRQPANPSAGTSRRNPERRIDRKGAQQPVDGLGGGPQQVDLLGHAVARRTRPSCHSRSIVRQDGSQKRSNTRIGGIARRNRPVEIDIDGSEHARLSRHQQEGGARRTPPHGRHMVTTTDRAKRQIAAGFMTRN